MTPEEIDGLVSKTLTGDRTAFRRLVLELEDDLRFLAGAFDVGEGLTEEVVQATFVTAYQKLASYRGGGAFRGWLRAIARNHVLRALRDQRRFTDVPGAVLEETLVQSGLDDLDRIDELDRQTRKLRSCMDRLPAALRALVQARYTDELSTSALAEHFQRSEIWIRVTLCRVRKSLRRCIDGASRA
jgi:RNA polymerase sigma-70 factor (ECF subfamily)